MPVYTVPIPTPGTSINRQLMHNVVENLMLNLGIVQEDVLFLGGAYDNASQPNSTVGDLRDVSFGNNARTIIEVDERRTDDGGFTRAVGYDLEAPLFHNPKYGIKCSPNYVTYEATITIKRRAEARSMLGCWTTDLQRKVDMGMDMFVTEGSYHYRIPAATLNMLAAAHRAISHNLTTPLTLKSFFKEGFHKGVTVATNDAGKAKTFIARTTATRIVGSIEPSSISKAPEGDGGAWISQFVYTFQYSRPESIVMSYPVMFNNRLISQEWWFESVAPGVSDESMASKGLAVAMQDKMAALPETISIPVHIPDCDRQRPVLHSRQLGELDLFVGYLEFDKSATGTEHLAFNIKDLGDIGFMYNQLTYLRLMGARDPHMLQSLIKIYIFKNGYVFDRLNVRLDRDLNVWITEDIDVLSVYRFSITLMTSLSLLDIESLDDVCLIPGFFGDILAEFIPELALKYRTYAEAIPRPCSPECPDLAEYPYNFPEPIPAEWIDPIADWRVPSDVDDDTTPMIDPNDPWQGQKPISNLISYPQYPNKPPFPNKYTKPITSTVIDQMVIDTVNTIKDSRSKGRLDVCSLQQLNIFNGTIIARFKD